MSLRPERWSATVMMARIRNEDRWIRRCMERTWLVAKHIVIWDDGSTDQTMTECMLSLGSECAVMSKHGVTVWQRARDGATLHYIYSPYRTLKIVPEQLVKFQVNEIRDKNALWEYVKANIVFQYVLCLDGDEMLSNALVRNIDTAYDHMEGGIDLFQLPFVYLWDTEAMQREDGIYETLQAGFKRLNFPRLFTIQRWSFWQLFESHFDWQGTKGGFHCGSIPRSQAKPDPITGIIYDPVVHFGYLYEADRQRKYIFYNEIDPGNKFEGEYKHIIGVPNIHAPGPVRVVAWEDK